MPPIPEPATLFLPPNKLKAGISAGLDGTPTQIIVPSVLSRDKYILKSCSAETVSRIKSNVPIAALTCASSVVTTKLWAPNFLASSSFLGDVLSTVTSAPNATPNLTAIWPNPPRPNTASL
ncbi:hypothetical protein D3C86_1360390 [compost metagenome]